VNTDEEKRIRGGLAAKLHPMPLREDVWNHMVKMRLVQGAWEREKKNGPNAVDQLEPYYLVTCESFPSEPPKREASQRTEAKQETDERAVALARILAVLAANQADVQAIRAELPGGRLLTLDAVPAWVAAQNEQAPSESVSIRLSGDIEMYWPGDSAAEWLRKAAEAAEAGRIHAFSSDKRIDGFLEYFERDSRGRLAPSHVPISRDSGLGHLYYVASELSQRFRWSAAWATTFVLTDVAPPITTVAATFELSGIPALERIVLHLDPRVPPRAVERGYRAARAQFRAGTNKAMSPEHLDLAVFLARYYLQRERPPWSAMQAEWSRLHPESRIQANFIRDAVGAWRRVTGLDWKREGAQQ